MLQCGMGRQDGLVRLNDGSGDLGSRINGEFQFRLFAVVDRETLHQQRGESRASSAAEGMEDEESLQTGALVGELADAIQYQVDDFLADGVVPASVIVGSIFLAGNELLGMEELAVSAGAHFIYYGRLQIDKDGARDVLSRTFKISIKTFELKVGNYLFQSCIPVSEKKVLKESSPPPIVLSDGIYLDLGKLLKHN